MLLCATSSVGAHRKEKPTQPDSFAAKISKCYSCCADTINPNLTPLQFYQFLLAIGVSGSVALQAYKQGYIDGSYCKNFSIQQVLAAVAAVGLVGTLWNTPCDEDEVEEAYDFYC